MGGRPRETEGEIPIGSTKDEESRPMGGESDVFGGADRDRTDDLLNAIQALSQLSYGPTGTQSVPKGGGVCQRFTRQWYHRRAGSAWGLVASADFKSVGPVR
jgi:hypothetical protein